MKIPGYPNVSVRAVWLVSAGTLALAACESYDPVPYEGQAAYGGTQQPVPQQTAEPAQPKRQPPQPVERKEPFSALASATASTMEDPYFPTETRPAPASAATVDAARNGVIPQAPYRTTPSYDSAYDDYWASPESVQANREKLKQDQRNGLVVTESEPAPSPSYSPSSASAAMPAGPAGSSSYGGSPAYGSSSTGGSQTLYSSRTGPEGYTPPARTTGGATSAPRSYSDLGGSSPAYSSPSYSSPAYSPPPASSSSSGLPEIPPAPETLPASTPRYVTADGEPYPEIGSDGLPVYPAPMSEPVRTSPARVEPALPASYGGYDSGGGQSSRPAASTPSSPPASGGSNAALPTRPSSSTPPPASSAYEPPSQPASLTPSYPASGPASSTPSYTPPAPAVSRSAEGIYAVHLASYRVRDHAINGWNVLTEAHPAALGGLTPIVSADEIPGLGLHYRLKAGPIASESAARSLCEQIKADNGDYCAVMSYSGEPF